MRTFPVVMSSALFTGAPFGAAGSAAHTMSAPDAQLPIGHRADSPRPDSVFLATRPHHHLVGHWAGYLAPEV